MDAFDPIQGEGDCDDPGMGKHMQDQAAVVGLFDHIRGQYGPRDIAGL